MSAASTLEGGRARKPAADDLAGAGPGQAAGKRTLAESAPSDLPGLDEDFDEGFDEGGDELSAGDWDMTDGLAAAMGLDGEQEAPAAPTASAAPVRRKAAAPGWANETKNEAKNESKSETDVARAGFSGPASDFPHRDTIERSFGAPLPATAYTGAAANRSSAALGAEGYALGNQVAFSSASPSLEVAAHEAAHVMQSTSGVQLHGGTGAYEDHADAVAARVVRGESSADLLAAGPVANSEVRFAKHKGQKGQGRSKCKQKGKGKGNAKRTEARVREPNPPDNAPKSSARFIRRLAHEIKVLIHKAQWSEMRKALYPQESREGIVRAKQREKGNLPELSGLGRLATMQTFAVAMKNIHTNWHLNNSVQRTTAIFTAINNEMVGAGVPAFLGIDLEDGNLKGAFYGGAWKIQIGKAIMEGPAPSEPDARDLCNTVLHEARHAEQNFLAARFAAGPPHDMTAVQIAASHGIPLAIAQQAFQQPFDRATDATVAALGKQMYQAFVTDGAKNQNVSDDDYLTEMGEAREAAAAARLALLEEGSQTNVDAATAARDTLKAAMDEAARRYTLYRNIPYEKDAHDVGDAVEQIYKEL